MLNEIPIAHAPEPDETRYENFAFTGDGREYFRIWIVNLALSVVTLGIYSAWAKVRRLQYFYRNVRVAGTGFDYHGMPIAILKGRIIAAALFATYYIAGAISPILGVAAAVVLAAVLPFLLVRSLRFRLHNSSYRAIRFGFHGGTGEAYWVMLGLPILSVFTLGLLAPLWHHRLKRFQHANASYGSTRFGFHAPESAFYKAYLITAVAAVVLLFFLVLWVIGFGMIAAATGGPSSEPPIGLVVIFLLMYFFLATAVWALTMAQVQNIVWRHTTLGRHRFTSSVEAHRLLGVVMLNTLGIIATLGLFKPFADVRLTRYIVGEMTLVTTGSMDDFVASSDRDVNALGEEALEMFDIDLAF